MKKKIKILGSGPTGSLLALFLASEKNDVVLVEPLSDLELSLKDKGYAITQSTRKILTDIGLWSTMQNFAIGFNSLSIIDDELSQSVILRTNDLKHFNKDQTSIGWVIEHKYFMQVLINAINKNKFINKFNFDSTNDKDFDFILAADGRDSSARESWKIIYLKRFYSQRCISFRAVLKGVPTKRAYEIFRHEGPLALLPLNNNIYQVIWFASLSSTQSKLQMSKYELLELLENILPHEIKPVSIVSGISNYSVAQAFALPKFGKFTNILVGDAAHSFHPVGGQGLNSCIRDVFELNMMIKNYQNSFIIFRKLFSLHYFLKRSIDILSLIIFTDVLIRIFSNKNILFYPFRFLIFYMLRKINVLRVNIFSLMTDSLTRHKYNKDN